MSTRYGTTHVPWAALFLLLASSCHSSEEKGLPPASGSGSPPAPAIPKLTEVASAAPALAGADSASAWTGSLFARHIAQLGPKMSGILSQITVDEGDHVKKGQLLFRLDSAQGGLAVEQAKAAIATAQVGYDAARLDLARATELFMKASIAPASFDQAKAAHDRALSTLAQAKVGLEIAQRSLADTAIYSPIDGVVTDKFKSLGETVTMVPATIVLVVQDVDKLELRAHLPEKVLASLEKGSVLRIKAAGITRDVPVKRVNPTIDARTRTIEVVADVDNADGKLKVGMLVDVGLGGTQSSRSPSHEDEPKLAGAAEPEAKAP
jgi:RND family efflux transporter MFP subunit